jgi:predicted phage terminase large subunit-like protein
VTITAPAADPWEQCARSFEARPRRYASPWALAAALDYRTRTSPALARIDAELVDLLRADSAHNALAVCLPPQEGKSQECARRLPEWLLDHDPGLRIAIVSYGEGLAVRWGRDIKNDVKLNPCKHTGEGECDRGCGGLHIDIRQDSAAAGHWETPDGGGIHCVGVGGALTGLPVDVLIIDDPVKDRAAAESETIREATWDWWESVALTRLAPGARVILIQTRWHEDDLAGRIAARPGPLKWKQLVIPAIAVPGDPLGREPGEELVSVRGREPGYFTNLRATMSVYVFSGVYQQTPTAPEGNTFRRAAFRYWRWLPPWDDGRARLECEGQAVTLADCYRFATMDCAASLKSSADYTVCSVWAITPGGDLLLLDRRRKRIEDHDHFAMVEPLRATWRFDMVYVEANYWSQTFVQDAIDNGMPVAPVTPDKDKLTRAIPAAGRVHAGRVWWPAETSGCECGNCLEGKWLDEWCDELAAFPKGTHDDQVDTLSDAARVMVADWSPPKAPPRDRPTPFEASVSAAHSAATGNGHGDLDIMNVPL